MIPRSGAALVAAAALALAATGCASLGGGGAHGHHHFSDDRGETLQMVNANIGGKNVYLPSTVVAVAGVTKRLSIFNVHDTPHGFRIPGLGIETVLNPGQETVVELPANLEGGKVYAINCQLHPPHRGASLVVLPGAE